jgi:hypothetical protein
MRCSLTSIVTFPLFALYIGAFHSLFFVEWLMTPIAVVSLYSAFAAKQRVETIKQFIVPMIVLVMSFILHRYSSPSCSWPHRIIAEPLSFLVFLSCFIWFLICINNYLERIYFIRSPLRPKYMYGVFAVLKSSLVVCFWLFLYLNVDVIWSSHC